MSLHFFFVFLDTDVSSLKNKMSFKDKTIEDQEKKLCETEEAFHQLQKEMDELKDNVDKCTIPQCKEVWLCILHLYPHTCGSMICQSTEIERTRLLVFFIRELSFPVYNTVSEHLDVACLC